MTKAFAIETNFQVLGLEAIVAAEIHEVSVGEASPPLRAAQARAAAEILAADEALWEADGVLEGYRRLVARAGRSIKKFPPAAEKLLRQVKRTGRLPSINAAVDSYNLVVVRHRLALGVHDADRVGSRIVFRLSGGGEPFTAIGGDKSKLTQKGDHVYSDAARVLAWLDSSDAEDAKVTSATRNILLVIQGTRETTLDGNMAAAEEACRGIVDSCGGRYTLRHVPPGTVEA